MSTSSHDASRSGYTLAYREARRELDDQERSVVDLRARAGALIATAAITTSLFGGGALAGREISLADWVAIACFALLGLAILLILWPRRGWSFSMAPDAFIATYLEPADGEPLESHLIERDLALHMGRSAEFNRRQLQRLMTIFRFGALLLVAEVLAWVLALVIRG